VVAEDGEAVAAAGAAEAVDLVERLAVAVEADALEGGRGELEAGEAARGRGAGTLLGGAAAREGGGVFGVVVVIVVFGRDGASGSGAVTSLQVVAKLRGMGDSPMILLQKTTGGSPVPRFETISGAFSDGS
jgi:hypothetical protein